MGAEQGHDNARWIPQDLEAKAQHHENGVGSLPSQQQGTKHELKVNFNNETLPFCYESKYLGVTLDRSLTYRRHLESLRKKLTSRVVLLRRLAGSGWCAEATMLRTATIALALRLQSTALLFGAAVLIPASLTPPSTTHCELWLDACVLHQRTTFQSSQASNLLSLVAEEPHSLQHAVPWSLDICSTQRSPVHRVQMHGAICTSSHNNSSVHLTTKWIVVRRRTVVRNSSREGLYVCAGVLGIWKCDKLHWFIVFHLLILGYYSFVSGG